VSNRRTFLNQTAAIGGGLGLSPLAKGPLEDRSDSSTAGMPRNIPMALIAA